MTALASIGIELVRLRRIQGISQRELGARLGVRQQQIARWEATAYRAVSLERVSAVAEALGYAEALPPFGLPIAAEEPVVYEANGTEKRPVRDLGELIARIREHGDELRDTYRWDSVAVFGSFAVGQQTDSGDVDLLVETEDPGGFRFFRAASFLEDLLGRDVDVVRPHLLRERLRDRILKEAVDAWSAG
jgi:predicted nucleotidyltransferase